MKSVRVPLIAIVALAYASVALGVVLAASSPRLFLPTVVNGAVPASICDGAAPILDQDTGSLSAMRDATGRYIVAYQDRAHGSLVHVAQHVGGGLEELAAPPALLDAAPTFSPIGPKQGSIALVAGATPNDKSRLYYTQRKIGDSTGPYGVWCMEF